MKTQIFHKMWFINSKGYFYGIERLIFYFQTFRFTFLWTTFVLVQGQTSQEMTISLISIIYRVLKQESFLAKYCFRKSTFVWICFRLSPKKFYKQSFLKNFYNSEFDIYTTQVWRRGRDKKNINIEKKQIFIFTTVRKYEKLTVATFVAMISQFWKKFF